MTIASQLQEHVYKEELIKRVALVANSQKLFNQYFELIDLKYDHPIPYQASWVVCEAVQLNKQLATITLVEQIITNVKDNHHQGTRRHLTKTLTFYDPIPIKYQSIIFDLCIQWILDNDELVALKIHAMQTAYNLCKIHPTLKHELIEAINYGIKLNTFAYQSRAKRLFKKLGKL